MLAFLSAVLLAQFTPPTGDEARRIEGRCLYPEELVVRAEGSILVQCGEAVLSEQGVTFAARGFSPSIRFVGTWEGEELRLSHIARRGRDDAEEARGFCRVTWRNDKVSAIVCTALAGPRSYLANFVVLLL